MSKSLITGEELKAESDRLDIGFNHEISDIW